MATGGRNNDWGTQANANFTKIETAIAGRLALASTGGTVVLTDDQARNAFIDCSGILASNRIIEVPNRAKTWSVRNGHTLGAFTLTMKTASGSAITIPLGTHIVTCDGSNVLYRVASQPIANGDMATMASNTVKGNNTGSPATPIDLTMTQLVTMLAAAGLAGTVTGEIKEWGGSIASIPAGYLFCNGAAVSRTTYAALFAAIGTVHGVGDGSTTFNLPDHRNIFGIGAHSDVSGVPNTTVTGGNTVTGGTKDAVVVDHTHTANVTDPGHTHTTPVVGTGAGTTLSDQERSSPVGSVTSSSSTTGISVGIAATGVSGTNQNLPPYRARVYMIKT